MNRLTGQTDRQMSALRTGRERQPWMENNPVPAGLLSLLQKNELVALRGNLCGCSGGRGADTEPPVCWKPCLEWESQVRGARSHSLPSAPQLCSASVRGSIHFLRPVYSCGIGNFIAISIMIIGAGSKESKMPLQGEITFDIAIYTSSCQAGARPNHHCDEPPREEGDRDPSQPCLSPTEITSLPASPLRFWRGLDGPRGVQL